MNKNISKPETSGQKPSEARLLGYRREPTRIERSEILNAEPKAFHPNCCPKRYRKAGNEIWTAKFLTVCVKCLREWIATNPKGSESIPKYVYLDGCSHYEKDYAPAFCACSKYVYFRTRT